MPETESRTAFESAVLSQLTTISGKVDSLLSSHHGLERRVAALELTAAHAEKDEQRAEKEQSKFEAEDQTWRSTVDQELVRVREDRASRKTQMAVLGAIGTALLALGVVGFTAYLNSQLAARKNESRLEMLQLMSKAGVKVDSKAFEAVGADPVGP